MITWWEYVAAIFVAGLLILPGIIDSDGPDLQ